MGAVGSSLKFTAGAGLLTAALAWLTGKSDGESSWNPLTWLQNLGGGNSWFSNNAGTAAGAALFAGLWSMPKAFDVLKTPLMSIAGIYTAYSLFKGTTTKQFQNVAGQVAGLGADLGIDLNTSGFGGNNSTQLTPEQREQLGLTNASFVKAGGQVFATEAVADSTISTGARVIADAQEAARIHDASARGTEAIISNAKQAIEGMESGDERLAQVEGQNLIVRDGVVINADDLGPDDPSLELDEIT